MAGKDYTCANCGAGFVTSCERKIYCSNRCKVSAWKAKNPSAHKAGRERAALALAAINADKPKYSQVSFNVCATCSESFVSRRKASYCSKKCQPSSAREPSDGSINASRRCVICANPCGYTFGRPRSYCSVECAKKSVSYKEARRVRRHKRRALQRCAHVENVIPSKVFDRDKWKCQLCGCATPKKMRGTLSDNAPELDHIVPLSKGGEHSYLNTQCACRKCNARKSDRVLGQLLLIG